MRLVFSVYDPNCNPILIGISIKDPATDSRRHLFPRGDAVRLFVIAKPACVLPRAWRGKSSSLARQRPRVISGQCEIAPLQRGPETLPCPIDEAPKKGSPFRVDGNELTVWRFH